MKCLELNPDNWDDHCESQKEILSWIEKECERIGAERAVRSLLVHAFSLYYTIQNAEKDIQKHIENSEFVGIFNAQAYVEEYGERD